MSWAEATSDFLRGEVRLASGSERGEIGALAQSSGLLLVEVEAPGPSARGRLGLAIEEAVEAALERRGAPPPGVGASSDLDAALSDQLFRARLIGARGIVLSLGSLEGIANLAGALDAEDSAVLRWWIAAAAERPVRLVLDRTSRWLGVYGPPLPLDLLLGSPIAAGRIEAPLAMPELAASVATMKLAAAAWCEGDLGSRGARALDDVAPSERRSMADGADFIAELDAKLADAASIFPPAAEAEPPPPEPAAEPVPGATAEANAVAAPREAEPAAGQPGAEEPTAGGPMPEPTMSGEPAAATQLAPIEPAPIEPALAAAMAAALADVEPFGGLDEPAAGERQSASLEAPGGALVEPPSDAFGEPPGEPVLVEPPSDPTAAELHQAAAAAAAELDEIFEAFASEVRDLSGSDTSAPARRAPALAEAPLSSGDVDDADDADDAGDADPEPVSATPVTHDARSSAPLPSAQLDAQLDVQLEDDDPPPAPTEPAPPLNPRAHEEWSGWMRDLEAARGPKPLAVIERLFVSAYVPLADAVAHGIGEPRARSVLQGWADAFEHSYTEAFDALRVRGKRPTMVLDVPDIAHRIARLHGARAMQLVLVDGMRFDLGLRVHERLRAQLGQRGACTERLLLWAALPTDTMTQLELLGRGPLGLRDLERGRREEIPVARGRGATTLRRLKTGSREVLKLDAVESRLGEPGGPIPQRLDAIATDVADALAGHLIRQPPRTLVTIFGDHGFRLDPLDGGSSAARSGGASPDEVLVPAFAWLVGAVH